MKIQIGQITQDVQPMAVPRCTIYQKRRGTARPIKRFQHHKARRWWNTFLRFATNPKEEL